MGVNSRVDGGVCGLDPADCLEQPNLALVMELIALLEALATLQHAMTRMVKACLCCTA